MDIVIPALTLVFLAWLLYNTLSQFHRHTWGRWYTVEEGTIMYEAGPKGFYLRQERTCVTCGKTILRIEKVRK